MQHLPEGQSAATSAGSKTSPVTPDIYVKLLDSARGEIRAYRRFYLGTVGIALFAAPSILLNAAKEATLDLGKLHPLFPWVPFGAYLTGASLLFVGLLRISPVFRYQRDKPNDFTVRVRIETALKESDPSLVHKNFREAVEIVHKIQRAQADTRKWFLGGAACALTAIVLTYGGGIWCRSLAKEAPAIRQLHQTEGKATPNNAVGSKLNGHQASPHKSVKHP